MSQRKLLLTLLTIRDQAKSSVLNTIIVQHLEFITAQWNCLWWTDT